MTVMTEHKAKKGMLDAAHIILRGKLKTFFHKDGYRHYYVIYRNVEYHLVSEINNTDDISVQHYDPEKVYSK